MDKVVPFTRGFPEAVEIVLRHEGAYSDHPEDPGGITKFGISKNSYPHLHIPSLTIEQAKSIYLTDYWLRCSCDKLPYALALPLFDAAVNCGAYRAKTWLQRALGVNPDGQIGPVTLAAVRDLDAAETERVLVEMMALRCKHYSTLKTVELFGKGWYRRSLEVFKAALA